jgi:hypothetical protein
VAGCSALVEVQIVFLATNRSGSSAFARVRIYQPARVVAAVITENTKRPKNIVQQRSMRRLWHNSSVSPK